MAEAGQGAATGPEGAPEPAAPPRSRVSRRWLHRLGLLLLKGASALAVFLLLLVALGALFSGRPVALPVWVVAETEARLNRALDGRAAISLGGLEVMFAPDRLPELRLQELRVSPPGGGGFVLLPEAQASFSGRALLGARVEPVAVRLSGPQIALLRDEEGRIDLDFGEGGDAPGSFGELLERIDAFFALPALATLARVEAQAVTITLDDRRAGRIWTVGDGSATLLRGEAQTVLDIGIGLVGGGTTPATARMNFGILHHGGGASLAVRVDNVAAGDIAAQAALLAWLGVLDAPISGDFRAALDGEGGVTRLEGALAIGEGALSPVPGAQPVPIRSADLVFGFDPARARLTVSQLAVDSPTLRLRAGAHADLIGIETGLPSAYLAQLRIDELLVDPAGVFAEPVRFSQGAMDMRVRLDPFSVELGQLALVEDGRHLAARGGVQAGSEGWTIALDVELDAIRHDRLLAIWPLGLVPNTRSWLASNVQEGLLFDVKAGMRLRPGQEPRLSLGYEFADADVRFMPTLPPIEGGRGYASIEGQTYVTVVEDGHVTAPMGGRIDVTRSVFRVPDITQVPAPAEITLQTASSVTAALSLLDQPPFGFLRKAGLSPDLGEGRARMTTELRLPLAARLGPEEVRFNVAGVLEDVTTDRLVPGRVLSAGRLDLQADNNRIEISGAGRLGASRFDARWSLPLGPGADGSGTVAGSVALDKGFAEEFLTALGTGVITGSGRAQVEIALPKTGAPRLNLRSDLAGVGIRIPELGWSKPANARGRLEVSGGLSAPLKLDRLLLEGPGLSATGQLALRADGQLERLALSSLKLGAWLEAEALVEGQGKGRAPRMAITGGRVDLRRLPAGSTAGAGGGGGAAIPVTLDRVQVSEGIALRRVRASIAQKSTGIDGEFSGLLNGLAPISGRMVPGPRGTAIRLRAVDGGAALSAAGIFTKAHGGALDLVLNPTGATGHYDGTLEMANFRVRNMPALAELLNAVSIIGLIEQLSTSGLAFAEARGQFRLTPDAVELRQGSAVGASFGVSLQGVYLMTQDRLDLQGVISPFYLLNGLGAVLTRPGEGLMGFTYRVRGSAADPRVSVNPLSVLAPGFFRDMLRRPAARIAE